ncbi:leucine-rich repeat-containing protein 23-like isoform X1 [Hypanus sabinus]|uniref:leucine-rich repeat-containing protein 23-like isoform X1 n=1 Tax=Hypanus sabinus TaxID=79690 RepID=UPI0028C4547F|nr:leucine-rich repeat-containing protein 23-like isoform X1 [Hypanus sabinus]
MSDTDGESDAGSQEVEDSQEAEDAQEDKPEQVHLHPLTPEIMAESLSLLCKTGNALAHAYVRVDLKDRELTDVYALSSFIHLRYVDISGNQLFDISPLAHLSQLLWLNAEGNRLTSARLDNLPFLQIASFARNRIQDTEGIAHPFLETLNLSHNQIRAVSGFDPLKLTFLHTLELRANHLESTLGICLPHLRHLYLAANQIFSLEGLELLVSLQTLHLRENQIEKLDGFSVRMGSLQYLNLRANQIIDIQQTKRLHCLPKLRALVLAENPCTDEESHRLEVLMALPGLQRLDKESFTPDERAEAAEALRAREQQEGKLNEEGQELEEAG